MHRHVYLYTFVFEGGGSIMTLNLSLLLQLNREAHRLRSVSYCELIILCWNCVRACMCVLLPVCVCVCVYLWLLLRKWQSRVLFLIYHIQTSYFLNVLTPWLLLMHLQCQSHSFELQRRRMRESKSRRKEARRGPEVRVQGGHPSLFVALCLLKKILNAAIRIRKPLLAEFQNTFGTIVFFPLPMCIQAASSHAAVSMAISICVRNSLTLSHRNPT